MRPTTLAISSFVPAADFEASRQFYLALGFFTVFDPSGVLWRVPQFAGPAT